jgi:hypothetical protein
MRKLTLAILVAAAALGVGSCADYFRGTTLILEFDKLPILHRILPADVWSEDNPTGALCADDDYVAAHPTETDDIGSLYQQRFEYHIWATINGGPVRLGRFSTRECTTSNQDTVIKGAVTTVSYVRLPDAEYAYPQKPSEWYGIVNAVVSSVPSGGVTILTDVRLEQATEVFVTRQAIPEGATEVDLATGPDGTLLMRGELVKQDLVLKATLAKVSGAASGLLTAIPADRVSAW